MHFTTITVADLKKKFLGSFILDRGREKQLFISKPLTLTNSDITQDFHTVDVLVVN